LSSNKICNNGTSIPLLFSSIKIIAAFVLMNCKNCKKHHFYFTKYTKMFVKKCKRNYLTKNRNWKNQKKSGVEAEPTCSSVGNILRQYNFG